MPSRTDVKVLNCHVSDSIIVQGSLGTDMDTGRDDTDQNVDLALHPTEEELRAFWDELYWGTNGPSMAIRCIEADRNSP